MKGHKTRTIPYRRKRQGKTNYKKRLNILLSGKPRLVVRKSLKDITAQIIQYSGKGDKVVVTVRGAHLKKMGWKYSTKNVSSAYLVGLMVGKKAAENGVKEAILDLGLQKAVPGSRVYSVLKGAVDSGLNIPHSDEVLPSEDRILGKHIEEYAKKLGEDSKKIFSGYNKNNAQPSQIGKSVEEIKKKITGA